MTYVVEGKLEVLVDGSQREINIEDTKFLRPNEGWEEYLSEKYLDVDEDVSVTGGTLTVWDEIRLPLPVLYLLSYGQPVGNFRIMNDDFYEDPKERISGSRNSKGIVLDLGAFLISAKTTSTNTKTSTYY